MNTYEKHRGVGVLLLTSYPARIAVLRSIATKDLSSHPMRMLILSERSESKDLSSHPIRMRILGSTFFFASLFCAAAFFTPASAGANRVQASAPDDAADLRSAKDSFDAGDYASARKTLQAAIEKSAADPEIHFWLGRSSYELFDFNSAAASFERAIQLQPKNSLYHEWLGQA